MYQIEYEHVLFNITKNTLIPNLKVGVFYRVFFGIENYAINGGVFNPHEIPIGIFNKNQIINMAKNDIIDRILNNDVEFDEEYSSPNAEFGLLESVLSGTDRITLDELIAVSDFVDKEENQKFVEGSAEYYHELEAIELYYSIFDKETALEKKRIEYKNFEQSTESFGALKKLVKKWARPFEIIESKEINVLGLFNQSKEDFKKSIDAFEQSPEIFAHMQNAYNNSSDMVSHIGELGGLISEKYKIAEKLEQIKSKSLEHKMNMFGAIKNTLKSKRPYEIMFEQANGIKNRYSDISEKLSNLSYVGSEISQKISSLGSGIKEKYKGVQIKLSNIGSEIKKKYIDVKSKNNSEDFEFNGFRQVTYEDTFTKWELWLHEKFGQKNGYIRTFTELEKAKNKDELLDIFSDCSAKGMTLPLPYMVGLKESNVDNKTHKYWEQSDARIQKTNTRRQKNDNYKVFEEPAISFMKKFAGFFIDAQYIKGAYNEFLDSIASKKREQKRAESMKHLVCDNRPREYEKANYSHVT